MTEPSVQKKKHKPVTAGGGVVYRIDEAGGFQVLLIYRNDVWDLPKGKLEKGESIEMCAAREVAEEVGSSLPLIVSELGTTYHEYLEKGKIMDKTTYWYSMIFSKEEELVPQKNEGITKVEWEILDKAIEKAGFENLKDILRKFRDTKKA